MLSTTSNQSSQLTPLTLHTLLLLLQMRMRRLDRPGNSIKRQPRRLRRELNLAPDIEEGKIARHKVVLDPRCDVLRPVSQPVNQSPTHTNSIPPPPFSTQQTHPLPTPPPPPPNRLFSFQVKKATNSQGYPPPHSTQTCSLQTHTWPALQGPFQSCKTRL